MGFENPLLRAWVEGRTTFGAFAMLPSPVSAEALARPGIDWVCADFQHGQIGRSDFIALVAGITARGAVPVARVAAADETLIGQALDDGALAVIVPLVEDRATAELAVAACRFPPNGRRSYGPGRFAAATGSWDPADAEHVACIVMVETAAGLANVEAIATTTGIDGIVIGASDLAISLGVSPTVAHETDVVTDAIARIREATTDAGHIAGIVCPDGTLARRYADDGFRMISVATDLTVLMGGVERELAAAMGAGADV